MGNQTKYRWSADKFFGGSVSGEVLALTREEALSRASAALAKHPDAYGGNVNKDTLSLTHQLRLGKRKWQEL